jgi:hypothetical protein
VVRVAAAALAYSSPPKDVKTIRLSKRHEARLSSSSSARSSQSTCNPSGFPVRPNGVEEASGGGQDDEARTQQRG